MSIEKHLDDLVQDRSDKMLEIEDFSRLLFVHPTHLTNTMKEVTGTSACGILQLKVMERALRLLADDTLSIKEVALTLTYEPSQFTKWFKRIVHMTPKQYRVRLSKMDSSQVNTEMVTILKKYADIPLFF